MKKVFASLIMLICFLVVFVVICLVWKFFLALVAVFVILTLVGCIIELITWAYKTLKGEI